MGIGALVAGAISFGKSIYDYRNWDRLTVDQKIDELRKEFNYSREILYNPTGIAEDGTIFNASHNPITHDITLTPNALSSKNYARWLMSHEVDHYYYSLKMPANNIETYSKKMRIYGGQDNYTKITEADSYNRQLLSGKRYNVTFRNFNNLVKDAMGHIELSGYKIDPANFNSWNYKMVLRNIF